MLDRSTNVIDRCIMQQSQRLEQWSQSFTRCNASVIVAIAVEGAAVKLFLAGSGATNMCDHSSVK